MKWKSCLSFIHVEWAWPVCFFIKWLNEGKQLSTHVQVSNTHTNFCGRGISIFGKYNGAKKQRKNSLSLFHASLLPESYRLQQQTKAPSVRVASQDAQALAFKFKLAKLWFHLDNSMLHCNCSGKKNDARWTLPDYLKTVNHVLKTISLFATESSNQANSVTFTVLHTGMFQVYWMVSNSHQYPIKN